MGSERKEDEKLFLNLFAATEEKSDLLPRQECKFILIYERFPSLHIQFIINWKTYFSFLRLPFQHGSGTERQGDRRG